MKVDKKEINSDSEKKSYELACQLFCVVKNFVSKDVEKNKQLSASIITTASAAFIAEVCDQISKLTNNPREEVYMDFFQKITVILRNYESTDGVKDDSKK